MQGLQRMSLGCGLGMIAFFVGIMVLGDRPWCSSGSAAPAATRQLLQDVHAAQEQFHLYNGYYAGSVRDLQALGPVSLPAGAEDVAITAEGDEWTATVRAEGGVDWCIDQDGSIGAQSQTRSRWWN